MRFTLLYIRTRQLKREISGLGIYTVLFLIAVVYAVVFFYIKYRQGSHAWYLVSLLAFLCLLIQYKRKDKGFIFKHISNPHLQVFAEYLLLTLPFSVSAIFTKSWYIFPALLFTLGILPFVKPLAVKRTYYKNLSSIIAAENVEWISGIRKNMIPVLFLYLAAACTCWISIVPLFFLWLLTMVCCSFHQESEPVQVLREGDLSASNYIIKKMMVSARYIMVLYIPVLVVNALFNGNHVLLNLLFIPAQLCVVCFTICLKYSTYKPGRNLCGNNIPLAIVSMGSVIPYFLPVPAILSVSYFYKAKKNLKQYLDD